MTSSPDGSPAIILHAASFATKQQTRSTAMMPVPTQWQISRILARIIAALLKPFMLLSSDQLDFIASTHLMIGV